MIIIMLIKRRKKPITYFMRIELFFIWTTLNSLHPGMLCAKFGWNWPSGSREHNFKILSMYFCHFVIISFWKRVRLFMWTNLNPRHPRMHCAKFGWNCPCGFGKKDENAKSLRQQRQRRRTIGKLWSVKGTWAFGSVELKWLNRI